MGIYGKTAVRAVNLYANGKEASIVDAWWKAVEHETSSKESQKKSCPRRTFFALCESGVVVRVPSGEYNVKPTTTEELKQETSRAIKLLQDEPDLATDPDTLWEKIGASAKNHNSRMDVITALWVNNYVA